MRNSEEQRVLQGEELREKIHGTMEKNFSGYLLTRRERNSISKMLFNLIQDLEVSSGFPYNVLIYQEAEEEPGVGKLSGRSIEYIQMIINAVQDVMPGCRPQFLSENKFLEDPETDLPPSRENRFLSSLRGRSSSQREKDVRPLWGDMLIVRYCTFQSLERWEAKIPELEDSRPRLKFFVVSDSEGLENLSRNDHLYYRVISHQIGLHPYTAEDALYALNREIAGKGWSTTPEFDLEIRKYVKTVYPTADLQEVAFEKDLWRRVSDLVMSSPITGAPIDKDCVPYYKKKPMEVEETPVPEEGAQPQEAPPEEATQEEAIQEEAPPEEAIDFNDYRKGGEEAIRQLIEKIGDPQGYGLKEERTTRDQAESVNILLLALSTFGSTTSRYSYKLDTAGESGNIYTGIYQLDPVTKLIAAEKGPLHQIIALNTKATVKPADNEREVLLYGSEDQKVKIKNISPEDYYKLQVGSYLRPIIDGETDTGVWSRKENGERTLYDAFYPILLEEDHQERGITEAVRQIQRHLEALPKKKINLYLDTHGGFRGTQLLLEAILSLVGKEKERFKIEIYSVEFDKEKTIQTITSRDKEMDIFDFVSGMNEFLNYGRAESIENYMSKKAIQEAGQKAAMDQKLLETIRTIASGIQLCDMELFHEGLKNLGDPGYIDAQAIEDEYLKAFLPTIQKDYGVLLENHSVVDEIEWCVNKGFVQQALTIIESRMPGVMLGSECFLVDWKQEVEQPIGGNWVPIPEKTLEEKIDEDWKKQSQRDPKPNWFMRLWWESRDLNLLKSKGSRGVTYPSIEKFLKEPKKVKRGNIIDPGPEARLTMEVKTFNKKSGTKETHNYRTLVKLPKDEKRRWMFLYFLWIHTALKNERNQTNHSAKNRRYGLEDIKELIETYIYFAKELNLHKRIISPPFSS